MDEFFNSASGPAPSGARPAGAEPDTDAIDRIAALLAAAARPVLILGTDVWADGAEVAALRLVEALGLPTLTNGMGRGIVPGGHPLLVTKARGVALGEADLVVVVGTPLDFRLGYGVFGGKEEGSSPAQVVHVADSAAQVAGHADLAASVSGDLTQVFDGLLAAVERGPDSRTGRRGSPSSRTPSSSPPRGTPSCSAPRPTRSTRRGSTASWCPGWPTTRSSSATAATSSASPASTSSRSGPAAGSTPAPTAASAPASARRSPPGSPGPSSQVVLLLGDGAAGFSLMDVDTLVRHDLPVVMVMGNNSAWGLEKGPMQMLYGYDVIADLAPRTPYDEVVKALGGAGETVTDPRQIGAGPGPRLRRRRALPRQRDHRRRRGLPAGDVRHLSARSGRGPSPATTPRSARSPWRRTRACPRPTEAGYADKLRDAAARDREAELLGRGRRRRPTRSSAP